MVSSLLVLNGSCPPIATFVVDVFVIVSDGRVCGAVEACRVRGGPVPHVPVDARGVQRRRLRHIPAVWTQCVRLIWLSHGIARRGWRCLCVLLCRRLRVRGCVCCVDAAVTGSLKVFGNVWGSNGAVELPSDSAAYVMCGCAYCMLITLSHWTPCAWL